jgi:predicted component of type VI protein secretion system
MFRFTIFEGVEEIHPVDARLHADGVLRIGRDPCADWVLADPSREISRWHCEFEIRDGALYLRCMGANGVFDENGARLPADEDIAVSLPSSLRLGPYRLMADHAPQAQAGAKGAGATMILAPLASISVNVPTDWQESSKSAGEDGGSLLDAFCDGAGLNASAFAADDPADILRQAGAVYRQMLLGIADLMGEREQMRQRFALAHTTIGGADNNPFKWAPSQRLAVDLLRPPRPGFLAGSVALASSLRDIKKHLIATFSGFRHALEAVAGTFNPVAIDTAIQGQGSLLKSRAAVHCEEVARRHADLAGELAGQMEGALGIAFLDGYHAAASELEGAGQ